MIAIDAPYNHKFHDRVSAYAPGMIESYNFPLLGKDIFFIISENKQPKKYFPKNI